ncbi:unnamed protein product [Anisakis simplex]|uniref:Activating signal cointegrator 1 (inferred by orthology to a human protein) n=1 Tax=Anisakis simplex TaxID=6269 RepID=A0A0M3J4G5_ANISI|nr:unnamed protein product [Anisakis simplex]
MDEGEHIPWPEDVDLRGPLFIAATARAATQAEIRDEVQKCRDLAFQNVYGEADGGYGGLDREYPLSYPSGAIVGRAMLMECLSLAEYVERYPQGECADSQEGFVLIFKVFDPLLVPIPHLPPQSSSLSSSSQSHELYTINKQLRTAIKHILDPYSFS